MAELEPMDVDDINDNKENAFIPNNVLRGQENAEGLDSSEYHMKLRYSTTPISSPMSKSYIVIADKNNDDVNNCNMTQSLNLTGTKSDTTFTGPRSLPLQTIPSEEAADKTINVLKQLDSLISDTGDVTITVSKALEDDENISLPSSSSVTPEAVTPTKEVPKPIGSPILRGIQSVFNMFRASQSPVSLEDHEEQTHDEKSSLDNSVVDTENSITASTPLNIHKKSESISSRDSRERENPVFSEKLEKDLEWNETTIIFSKEKFPIHKLLFQQSNAGTLPDSSTLCDISMAAVDQSDEAMDISYNDTTLNNKTVQGNNVTSTLTTEHVQSNEITGSEKDESVFLDCETTLNESQAQNIDKSNNRTLNKTFNDASFISVQSAETVTCTSDMTENFIVSESFVQENQDINAIAHSNIALEKSVETMSHADSSSTGCVQESQEIVIETQERKSEGIPEETVKNNIEDIQQQINSVDEKLTDIDNKSQNDVSSTESSQGSHEVVTETQVYKTFDQDKINSEKIDKITYEVDVIQCQTNIVDEQLIGNNLDSVQETYDKVNESHITKTSDENEITAEEIDTNTIGNAADHPQFNSNEELTEKNVIEKLDSETDLDIKKTEDVVLSEAAGPVCVSQNVPSPIMPGADKDNTQDCKDIISSKVECLENDKNKTEELPELTEAMPEDCNVTVSLQSEPLLVSENNVSQSIEVASLPYSVNELATEETSNENIVSSTQDAPVALPKPYIENIADSTIDVLSFPAVVDITPDGSLIITTEDKETIEIPSEDISMVDADMLVPEDEQEQELPNDTATKIDASAACVTSQLSEKSNVGQISAFQDLNEDQCKEEEIIISESNSPYVSLGPEVPETESVKEDIITSPEIKTTPESPKIVSVGYNFNFDEINEINPFATRTRLSISPTKQVSSDKPTKSPVVSQIMESFPKIPEELANSSAEYTFEKKDCVTFKADTTTLEDESINAENSEVIATENKCKKECKSVLSETLADNPKESKPELTATKIESKDVSTKDCENVAPSPIPYESSNELNAQIVTSSQYSIDASSCEIGESLNRSDATNTKELSHSSQAESPNINQFSDKEELPQHAEQMDQKLDTSYAQSDDFNKTVDIHTEIQADTTVVTENVSDASLACSEDKDVTVREIHTEDEDTAEGPNIEAQMDSKEDCFSGFVKSDCGIFDDLPPEAKDEPVESDEMFIDAEAFEFLMSQNRSNEVISSGKESLFLKFDPLFAKRVNSDGVLDILSKVQKRQSTPKKLKQHQSIMDMSNEEKPGPSSGNRTFDVQAHDATLNNTRQRPQLGDLDESSYEPCPKPTMIVTPVVPKNNMKTPTRNIRRSTGVQSPAIAVIDRLLSISANNSMAYDDPTIIHYNPEQEEADRALIELRELVAVKELEVYQLKSEGKELKDRLFTMESQMENLDREGEKRLKAINALNEQLNEKEKMNKSMKDVVEEYEKTIAGLISEIENDKKRNAEEKMQLIRERDEQTAHLANMEGAFSDLHSKYEKSKQIILSYKANEDAYKKSVEEFEASLIKMEKNYDSLKEHATAQLDHANQELEKINKAHETEVVKLKAMIKRKDLHITSLEENIAQKMKANEELTAICDELISKVG